MTDRDPGGRPRNPDITSEQRDCPRCGVVTEFRRHKVGPKYGHDRWQWRCMGCNRRRNNAWRARQMA